MSDHDPINELTDVVDLFGAAPRRAESSPVADDGRDPLYDKAVMIVRAHQRASLSLIQRTLLIGYNRTSRLFDAMEARGVVSKMGMNGHRTVLPAAPQPPKDAP